MPIRKQEFGLLEHLLNRVVATHTAVDVWLSIDNDALEECRGGGRSANGLPYHAVGGRIFGGLISAENTRDLGIHVQCRHSGDKAEACELYNTTRAMM